MKIPYDIRQTHRQTRRRFGRGMAASLTSFALSQYARRHAFATAAFATASGLEDTLKRLDRTSPDTPLIDASGGIASLAMRVDRPMLVNLWASWCPPCIHELPSLVRLDKALESHGMAVMLIGLDRKGAEFAQAFLDKRDIKISRSVFEPSGALVRALNVKAMPSSFFIKPHNKPNNEIDARIIGAVEGPLDWGADETIAQVAAILNA